MGFVVDSASRRTRVPLTFFSVPRFRTDRYPEFLLKRRPITVTGNDSRIKGQCRGKLFEESGLVLP